MRPLWKGAISFGLVNIPVALYPATRSTRQIKFHLLRDRDTSPIRYKRVAEADDKEVDWEHIVKGYEYEKDQYVVLNEDDFKRVRVKSSQVVEIQEFVDMSEIDPRFFDEPYYLAPEKHGAKAYTLLREALEKSGKVGIAKVVLRPPREHLAAVRPLDGMLTLELMHFADELRDPAELQIPNAPAGPKELNMATSLVNSMADRWKPEKYRDEYHDALLEVIDEKIKAGGKALPVPKAGKRETGAKVVDLVSMLQDSLDRVQKKPSAKTSRRTRSPRRAAA